MNSAPPAAYSAPHSGESLNNDLTILPAHSLGAGSASAPVQSYNNPGMSSSQPGASATTSAPVQNYSAGDSSYQLDNYALQSTASATVRSMASSQLALTPATLQVMTHVQSAKYVQLTFEEQHRPIGLVLGWGKALPIVKERQPMLAGKLWPQVVPGLALLTINGSVIPPGMDRWEIETQLQARPLTLGFDVVNQKRSVISDYKLGECYRALATVIVRETEDTQSREVAKAQKRAIMEVVKYGIDKSGRRLRVCSGGVTGWISCMSKSGMRLLDVKPALESEHGDIVPAVVADTTDAIEVATLNKEQRMTHMLSVAQERSNAARFEDDGSDSDGDDGRPHSMRMTKIASMFGKRDSGDMMMSQKSTWKRKQEKNEILRDSDMTAAELEAASGPPNMLKRAAATDFHTYRDKAFWELDINPHGLATDSRWVKIQRATGILELRVLVLAKKKGVANDGSPFPVMFDLAEDMRFEVFIALHIVANTVLIAADTFYTSETKPFWLSLAEHYFTLLFVVEFVIRILAYSWAWCFSVMNMFDIFLIWFTGVIVMWILSPAGVDVTSVRRLGALRILRLARICRTLRIMPMFKDLWMLVQGILTCSSLLVWVILIGACVHYTFAVAVLELVAKDPKFEDDEPVQDLFGTLARSMFTLFQIFTFDSWSSKVRPIVQKDPKSLIVFFVFMGLAGIVLSELMTAIVIRNSFDAAAGDTEAILRGKQIRDHKIRTELQQMFTDLDEDNSGYLSIEEFMDCMDDFAFVRKMKMLDIDLEELPDIYEIIDDGDGQVVQDEFIGGMIRMQGPAMSGEMLKATCGIKQQNVHFVALEDAFVQNAMDTFRSVDEHVNTLHENFNDIIQLSAEVVQKLDKVGLRKVVKASTQSLPFLMDPTPEELQKQEKLRKKQERKTRKAGLKDTSEVLPPESFMKTKVPASWIIKNGKSPLAQNPGKVKLQNSAKLKERLITMRAATPPEEGDGAPGVHKDFQKVWADQEDGLGIHLRPDGLLDLSDACGYGELPPEPTGMMANSLHSFFISPSSKVSEAKKEVDPLAAMWQTPSAKPGPDAAAENMSLTPQVTNQAPTQTPSLPGMAMP